MRRVYYYIKKVIGDLLYNMGILAEISTYYAPEYKVYWGRTMWRWKRDMKREKKFREDLQKFLKKGKE